VPDVVSIGVSVVGVGLLWGSGFACGLAVGLVTALWVARGKEPRP
jgi:hypothetical protein